MSNFSSDTDKDIKNMDMDQRLALIKALNGIGAGRESAPDDEPYAIFTSGEHAGREFRRIPRPSYSQRKAVEAVRLKAGIVDESVKQAICQELAWDPADKASDELSMIAYHQQVLPLICREALPEGWDIEDVSSYEVQRMLEDFLLGT